MSDEIQVRFRWTADELLAGFRWHTRHRVRPVYLRALWFILLLMMGVGCYELIFAKTWYRAGYTLVPGLYVIGYLRFFHPWLLRRQFSKRPDRDAEIEWFISPDSLRAKYTHGTSEFGWPALAKVVQTPEGFLFYPTEQIFHWIPRHAFVSDSDYMRLATLAEKKVAAFRRTV